MTIRVILKTFFLVGQTTFLSSAKDCFTNTAGLGLLTRGDCIMDLYDMVAQIGQKSKIYDILKT